MLKPLLLLVEDEPLIVLELEHALNEAGYECIVVTKGQSALDELNQDADRFQGLLTDIGLGEGPDGWDIAHRARELVPAMPIIYISAHGASEWASKGVPNSLMIPKPFAVAQIITAIAQLSNKAAIAMVGQPPQASD